MMTKLYAIDVAKKLFRENEKSYFVVRDPESDDFYIVDKDEQDLSRLQKDIIFSIEV